MNGIQLIILKPRNDDKLVLSLGQYYYTVNDTITLAEIMALADKAFQEQQEEQKRLYDEKAGVIIGSNAIFPN